MLVFKPIAHLHGPSSCNMRRNLYDALSSTTGAAAGLAVHGLRYDQPAKITRTFPQTAFCLLMRLIFRADQAGAAKRASSETNGA